MNKMGYLCELSMNAMASSLYSTCYVICDSFLTTVVSCKVRLTVVLNANVGQSPLLYPPISRKFIAIKTTPKQQ